MATVSRNLSTSLPAWACALIAVVLTTLPATGVAGEPCFAPVHLVVQGEAAPVRGAEVAVLPDGPKARSGKDGTACLPKMDPGHHSVVVVADGYGVANGLLVVEASGAKPLTVPLLPAFGEELVVTGTRTQKRLADTPVHVQVMGREQVESTISWTLADAVEWAPGLRVENNCQNCNFAQVRMLGLEGPYSQILIDGQPLVSSLAMVYGVEHLPARLVESIEVVKGGGSAIYGAGTVGGVINLIPHRPNEVGAAFEARGTSSDGRSGSSYSAVGDWVSPDRSRGASIWTQVDDLPALDVNDDGFSDLGYREMFSGGLSAQQYMADGAARLDVGLTWGAEERRGGEMAFHRAPHETILSEGVDSERLGGSLSWLHTVSPRFDYRLSSSYVETQRDSYYGADFDPDAYGTTENPMLVLDGQANHYRKRHTLTWGVQFRNDEMVDTQPAYQRQIEESYSDVGIYLQDDRNLGANLTLLVGARVDQHSEIDDPILSPRLAMMWSPRSDLTVRGSVARGFRAPVVFDEDLHILHVGGEAHVIRNASDLQEESATAATLSTEWRPTFGSVGSAAVELNLFRTDLSELFNVRELDDPTTPEVDFVRENFGRATVQGVELNFAWRWGSKLQGEIGWVQQTSRFAEPEPDFGSRSFLRTPEQYGLASVIWRMPAELDLFVGLRYTGSMKAAHYAGYIAEDRLETTPSFLTVDLNVSRDLPLPGTDQGTLTLTLGGKNLTNAYQEDLDRGPARDAGYVYGPRSPRSVVLGLKVDL